MPFFLALGIALALTPLFGVAGRAAGLVDRPGALKIHERAVPLTGGIAVVVAALAAAALAGYPPPALLVLATVVALGVGIADDRRPLSPAVRLAGQAVAGVSLAAALPGHGFTPLLVAAALLVPACANAVNIIDGQDGLAGGLVAAAGLGLAALVGTTGVSASLQLGVAGAAVGFLAWNRPPARIFLGNGGAYAVGTLLAAGASGAAVEGGWPALAGASLCLGVFAFEVCFSIVRRVKEGRAITSGDRFHSYDLLSRRHRRIAVTMLFWVVGAAASAVAVSTARSSPSARVAVVVAVCLLAAEAGRRLLLLGSRFTSESVADAGPAAGPS